MCVITREALFGDHKAIIAILSSVLIIGHICTCLAAPYSSDAIKINWIESPKLFSDVTEPEWVNATFLDINFTFSNGQSYNARVYLGHNGSNFFVGAIIYGAGPNPYTVPDYVTRPDGFHIYFDVNNDENLTSPEAGRGILNFIGVYQGNISWHETLSRDHFWTPTYDIQQERYWRESRPEIEGELRWDDVVNAGMRYNEPYNTSTLGWGSYHGGLVGGDEHFEFTFPLDSNITFSNGLQLKTGETKTIGFCLEFYRQGYYFENGTRIPDLYDYWPGEGFTPNVVINASQYAKMRLDLSLTTNGSPNATIVFVATTITVLAIILVVFRKKLRKRQDITTNSPR